MNLKKVARFALGPIGTALLGVVSIPIMTRIFSQEDIGRLTMLQITIQVCILFFSLGLDQAYVREYHEESDTSNLLKQTTIPGLVLMIFGILLLQSTSTSLSKLLFNLDSAVFDLLIFISIVSSFLSRFLLLVLRMEEKATTYSFSQFLPKIILLFIVLNYILWDSKVDFSKLLIAYTLTLCSVTTFAIWNTRHEILKSSYHFFDLEKLLKMIKYGFPLIIGGVAYWGLIASDRVFLRIYSNYAELGIYSVALSLASGATLLSSIFSTIWAPTVYKWASTEDENLHKISQVTEYLLAISVIFFGLAGLFSGTIIVILPTEYSAVRYIFVACLSCPLLYVLTETTAIGIGISRKTLFAMLASVLSFIVNLAGNYFLVPLYGAAGAAISTSLSFWFFLLVKTEFSCRLWFSLPRKKVYFFSFLPILIANLMALFDKSSVLDFRYIWFLFLIICLLSFKNIYRDAFEVAYLFYLRRKET